MLKIKTKDELIAKLIDEYEMMILLVRAKNDGTKKDIAFSRELQENCSGRIKSLKWSLGLDKQDKEEE
tara:strand:- start:361 stop:564 length:204 start_codon:yes stop_codon:yes gene_type:complete